MALREVWVSALASRLWDGAGLEIEADPDVEVVRWRAFPSRVMALLGPFYVPEDPNEDVMALRVVPATGVPRVEVPGEALTPYPVGPISGLPCEGSYPAVPDPRVHPEVERVREASEAERVEKFMRATMGDRMWAATVAMADAFARGPLPGE